MGARRRVSPFMIWAEIISQIPAKKLAAAAASTVNALLLLLLMLESLQAFWSRSSTIHALANFEKFTRAFLAPNPSSKSVSGRLVVSTVRAGTYVVKKKRKTYQNIIETDNTFFLALKSRVARLSTTQL